MSYPSLHGDTYVEGANFYARNVEFKTNDLLLCIMLFTRIIYLIRAILLLTTWRSASAGRVCQMYGCENDNKYALKLIMKDDSPSLIVVSTLICLLILSYSLRLFEQ